MNMVKFRWLFLRGSVVRILKYIIAIVFLISINNTLAESLPEVGEDESKVNGWYSTSILGLYRGAHVSGIGLTENLSFSFDDALISVRHSEYQDISAKMGCMAFLFLLDSDCLDEPNPSVDEYAVLYGKEVKSNKSRLSYGVGLSKIKLENMLDIYDDGDYYGIALEFQKMWVPYRYFGLGCVATGSINKKNSFGSVNFVISIGDIR